MSYSSPVPSRSGDMRPDMTPIRGKGVFATYEQLVSSGTLQPDPAQRTAAMALDRLATELTRRHEGGDGFLSRLTRRRPQPLRGLYLVGDVGRGKTMLMDLFCREIALEKKRRIHFHVFMQEVLRVLNRPQSRQARREDPVRDLAGKLHAQYDLLCFDEFQINDMSDALLVLRLLDLTMALGTVVVATSNTAPDALMKSQTQNRATMKPYLEAFSAHMDVLTLEAVRDYRRGRLPDETVWLVPDSAENSTLLRQAFEAATGGRAEPGTVAVGSRRIAVPACRDRVAWFGFEDLCGTPLGPADYLALASQFHTLFLDAIPALVPDDFDKVRRFITLVDVLYENRVRLRASAASLPETLYRTGENARAFERTASRLDEMRAQGWGEGQDEE